MDKVLTIIIPTYNMEKYLHKCLDSLIVSKDCMSMYEVFVIIDGAKDRSSEIGHSYQEKYPNTFKVIDKENGNYGSCINRGLKEASGKYIKVLDADDSFHTENFHKYLLLLDRLEVDLILSDFVYKNENDVDYERKTRTINPDTILCFNKIVEDFNKNLISMHELTYNRSVFFSLNYHQTEGISYTDLEWCFMPMTKVNTVYYYNNIVYRYLIGREGQTVNPEVAMRTISHRIKSVLVMLDQFCTCGAIDNAHGLYIKYRLLWSIEAIYYNYLVSNPSLNNEQLKTLDNAIAEKSQIIYNNLSDCSIHPSIPYHYIHKWRSNGYKNGFVERVLAYALRSYSRLRK